MFQIAAAVSLAKENNDEPVFDVINHDLPNQGRKCHNYIKTIFRNLRFSSRLPLASAYREPHFHYSPIPYAPNMCLVGYFQSEKYFDKYATEIRTLFTVDPHTQAEIDRKYGEVLKEKPIAMHVRRGDYLKYSDVHPPCTLQYYRTAMDNFPENSAFLIVSDDIDWCRESFPDDNVVFVENNEDIVDFYLISQCFGIIISNSSFSWWAAWLSENGEKKIIAPKRWFGGQAAHDIRDLIPSRWKQI